MGVAAFAWWNWKVAAGPDSLFPAFTRWKKIWSYEPDRQKIDRIRKMILQLLLAHAPDAFDLQDLAREYGADKDRFEKEASFCIHCGLCVRYCAEVKKKNAVGFVDRGIRKEISFIPEIASKECWNCKECFPLCPTEALQAAYVLAGALAFPSLSFGPLSGK